MGKASRWLRNLFLPGWKSRKAKDRGAADADCQSVLSAPLPTTTPAGREKRRWSFRRPGAGASGGAQGQGPLASSSSHCFSEAEVHVVIVAQEQEQDHHQHIAAAVVPEAASSTEVSIVVPLPASSARRSGAGAGGRDGVAAAAAVKIQAAFRSYLARKALCALRGMVKLQAMVRGQLVRRQANLTLRRMQALVNAQRRARAERLRLLDVEDGASSRHQPSAATPRPPPSRRSPLHPRSRKPPEAVERGSEEHEVRIVEVDDGAPRASARRNSSYSASTTTPSRTPAKAEDPCQNQKISPTTPSSARTDESAGTLSGRLDVDDASFTSASEPSPVPVPSSRRRAWRADPPSFPSYMANTESSRAKARSQSAPRQRLSSASEPAAASPSPSCWERPPSRAGGGGSVWRRASLDPMDLPGGGAAPSRRVERCASRARASTTMLSVPGSECGSSSTIGHQGSARTGHGMGGY